jgi:hypothetical protein
MSDINAFHEGDIVAFKLDADVLAEEKNTVSLKLRRNRTKLSFLNMETKKEFLLLNF